MLKRRIRLAFVALPALLVAGLLGTASPASAAWPGANGKLAYTQQHDACQYFARGLCDPAYVHIFTANPDGSAPADVSLAGGATGSEYDYQPSWSADGKKIAFSRSPDYGESYVQIWTMNADGTGQLQVTHGDANHTNPSWSPDGSRILYVQRIYDSADSGIWVINSDGSGTPQQLDSDYYDATPVWSPDGTQIAFFRGGYDGPPHLFVMKSDGTNPTDLGVEGFKPDWAPDSSRLVFTRDLPTGKSQILVVNRDGTGEKPVTGDTERLQAAVFSPDGLLMSYVYNHQDIGVMSSTGATPHVITSNDHLYDRSSKPDWQPIPVVVTTPPPVPTPAVGVPAPAAPKVVVAGIRRACVSKSFTIRFRVATAAGVKQVTVKLDGKRIKSTTKVSFTLRIKSQKLKAGRHVVTISAVDANGKATTSKRTFSVCKAVKPKVKTLPRFTG